MTIEIAKLFPRQGQWTEEDYLSLPGTNRLIEPSEGRLVILPMPTISHQRVVGKLLRLMSDYVEQQGLGEVAIAPLRIRLWPGKFSEPDIVFISASHADRIGEEFWGVPDLVVEVISPRTEHSSEPNTLTEAKSLRTIARQVSVNTGSLTPRRGRLRCMFYGKGFITCLESGDWGNRPF